MSNRKIYRHSSNEGSVIEFDMYGKAVKLFVADAKYRAVKPWRASSTDTSLSNFMGDYQCINPTADGDDRGSPLSYNLTDQELQARLPSFKTDKTAKENTDALMAYNDTEAAHWCRAQNISGVGALDLPNIYELIVLYLEADNIDALDPTAEQYPNMMLGYKATNGRFYNIFGYTWSSTEHGSSHARVVGWSGDVFDDTESHSYGVVPVKELPIIGMMPKLRCPRRYMRDYSDKMNRFGI